MRTAGRRGLLTVLILAGVVTGAAGQQTAMADELKEFYYYGPNPTVSGIPYAGETLTVTRAGLLPDPSYVETRWTLDGVLHVDADHSLPLTPDMVGTRITCTQVYAHPGYRTETLPCAFNNSLPAVTVSARPGGPIPPTPTPPTPTMPTTDGAWTATTPAGLKGRAEIGTRLRAVLPQLTAPAGTYSYQWLRNNKPIKKATKATYRIRKTDRGRNISVRVTASAPRLPDLVSVSPAKRVRR